MKRRINFLLASPININAEGRKVRSFYKWLAKVTGVDACWIEGTDEFNHPVWGFVKRITGNRFFVRSRRLAAASIMGAALCLTSPSVNAQSLADASNFRGQNGFTITKGSNLDNAGHTLATGDINGDGFEDLIVGANTAYPGGLNRAGQTFVVFGSSSGFDSTLSLSSLDGSNGFILNGSHWSANLGNFVASDDVNGDGIDDIIIAASKGTSSFVPVYVVFGKSSAFSSQIEITSAVDGTDGFILSSGDQNISKLATGDINGDTVPDMLLGSNSASPNGISNAGQAYVVFGQTGAFADTLHLSSLDGNSSGFLITGNETSGQLGSDLASGDINGDGFWDVLVSSPLARSNYGDAHVVFGKSDAFVDTLNVSSLDGSNGFRFRGNTYYDKLGLTIGSGDINGDGFDDLLVSDYTYYEYYRGKIHVLFGGDSFPAVIDDSSLNGANGFFFTGVVDYSNTGEDFASVDLNGDGMDELITGSKSTDGSSGSGNGAVYVVFGFDDSSVSEFQLSSLDSNNGFVISESEAIGERILTGDLDGDGHDEVISSKSIGGSRNWLTTVFFNTINQNITGNEGYRMLSAPTHGPIFNELLEPFWTQGFTGSDGLTASNNVWTWDESTQAWTSISNQTTDSLAAGNGFLFYIFEDDNHDAAGNTGFPKRISVSQFAGDGTFNSGAINPVSGLADGAFFLAGNPFGFTVDWDFTSVSKTNLSNTIYIYDDAASGWKTWNGITGEANEGEIAPFQAFFIQGSGGNGSLSMGEGAISDSAGVFLKQIPADPKILEIQAEAGNFTADAWLSFHEGGELDRDAYDGLALMPLSANYLRLVTTIENLDELQINALPIDYAEELRFPLELSGVLEAETAELSFEGLEDFEGWSIFIEDLQTDLVYELEPDRTIELEIRAINAKELDPSVLLPTPVAVKGKTEGHRFQIVLIPGNQVNTEPKSTLPETMELQQNYPNPFNPTTSISFTTTTNALVRLEVFDSIGRKVAELLNEPKTAGRYSVNFDASQLASGLYIYRLQVGNNILTKRMTLIK